MIIVGHRGACGHAPENTLKSFAKAVEMGCQRVEFDVHLSRDGVPVVIHDDTLDRSTNGKGPVRSLTLAELKRLDAGEGESIPTLTEVMDFCREKVDLQIELKGQGCPPAVADLLSKRWDPKRVVVTSFDLSMLAEFAVIMPGIAVGLLNKDPKLEMVKVALSGGHRWIGPRFDAVTRVRVNLAHGAGLLVYVYHVNERKVARKIVSWGVDAMGTDYPEIASGLIEEGEAP
jgi:glycerophosphoryl diester phosphodiesterase